MKRRTGWIAGLSAFLLVLATTATVVGYQNEVKGALSISISATAHCGTNAAATATLLDANGAPIPGESVAWSFVISPSNLDRMSPTPTITNAKGQAVTTLTLANVAGIRRIRATAKDATGEVSGTVVLNPSCGSLPNTSTLPPLPSNEGRTPLGIIFGVLAFAAVCGLGVRRFARTR